MPPITFDLLPDHPASKKFCELAPAPEPGEILHKFKVVRIKCVSTMAILLRKLLRVPFQKELRIIPHPKSIRVCWVVETSTQQKP